MNKAKLCCANERKIRNLRDKLGLVESVNFELTFYVFYNLANIYHANGLRQDALNSYTIILKNKNCPHAGRLRINMGNIEFELKNYD